MDLARHLPALVLTGAIWGLTPSLAKLAMVGGGVAPMAFAFWQALGWLALPAAGLVLAGLFLVTRAPGR